MKILSEGAGKLGLPLSQRQIEQFAIYHQELIEWNQKMNLTAITDDAEVQVKHFLDSLTVVTVIKEPLNSANTNVIDVGTGAGLPGIPLKILFPEMKLTLLEATAKKAEFLNHLEKKLGLNGIKVVVGRAEEVGHDSRYREMFDLVLSRAVAPLAVLVELTIPFCRVSGSLITHKKGDIDLEVSKAAHAISFLGGDLREIKTVDLDEFADDRWLVVIDKIKKTPWRYPRRPGIPAKRPLL